MNEIKQKPIAKILYEVCVLAAKKAKISKSAFGSASCGNPKIIKRLKEGHGVESHTMDSIRECIATIDPKLLEKIRRQI